MAFCFSVLSLSSSVSTCPIPVIPPEGAGDSGVGVAGTEEVGVAGTEEVGVAGTVAGFGIAHSLIFMSPVASSR